MVSNRLGDFISDNLKKEINKRKLVPGSIIKTHVGDTNPPKYKRFIIIGEDEAKYLLGTVYINSEVNPNLFPTKKLKDLHIFFPSKKRKYLNHDSYVDCSQIKPKSKKEIEDILEEHSESYLGELTQDDLKLVKEVTKSAFTIDNFTKKRFGL